MMNKNWTELLAEFLRKEELRAVRLDEEGKKVSVARVGKEGEKEGLQERLEAVLAEVGDAIGKGKVEVPAGFVLRDVGKGVKELAGESCETSVRFWNWKDYEWKAEEGHVHEAGEWKLLAWSAGICGVFGLTGFLLERFGVEAWWVKVLYAVALAAGGWDAAVDSWGLVKKGKLDIHFLMLAVAVGAMCVGAWSEAVLLLFLFSGAGAMEEYAADRTQREVGALLKAAPKQAVVLDEKGQERLVKVEELCLGDRVLVRSGEAFPADGEVLKGKSASDESAITGEATPVEKGVGDGVFSGTLNLWGVVEFEVRRLPSESTLQKIIRLIEGAQRLKAPSQRFTDKFGAGYTWFVLGVCGAMFLVWWLAFGVHPFGEGRSAFYRAMTLLVVMSPCALVLSIPSAILAAIAWGARHGVLFRGGAAVERMADVGALALDKTGTLTTGELVVTGYESFPAGKETEVMELAYALEVSSTHPLARAIVKDAKARGVKERDVAGFESLTGQGVRGEVDGAKVLLGRRELLEKGGVLKEWVKGLVEAPSELAEVWVVGKDFIGRVLLKDEIRRESRGVLEELKREGVRTVMLTGDRRKAAESVAKEIGLEDVRAGLSPEEKVAAIQELKTEVNGKLVAMVGDGVNDAPCLAAADVSVAMGARGSDAALEQAEVILMHDRIENVLSAFRLSRRARRVIKANLAISLGVVIVMGIGAVLGEVPLSLGVVAHEGSTVVVCLNSLRLLLGRNG